MEGIFTGIMWKRKPHILEGKGIELEFSERLVQYAFLYFLSVMGDFFLEFDSTIFFLRLLRVNHSFCKI